MFGITDLPAYVLGTVVIVLLPGPNSLFVLRVAASLGVSAAWRAAAGVVAGDSVLMLAAALGMTSLIHHYPTVFAVLRMLGAGYLAYLAIGLMAAALKHYQQRHQPFVHAPVMVVKSPFWQTCGICLTNPKAILFFMSFFVQFVDSNYSQPALSFFILGVILQVISISYLTVLIYTGARFSQMASRQKMLPVVANAVAAFLFLGFSVRLVTAPL